MTNYRLLRARLPILLSLLMAIEVVNLVKLSIAMSWTNGLALGIMASISLGAFLIGSIVALSFDLEDSERRWLQVMVIILFVVQTCLVCLVSFLKSLTIMPAEEIALLLYTPVEATRRVVALTEGASLSIAAFAFWGFLGNQWRREINVSAIQDQVESLLRQRSEPKSTFIHPDGDC